MRRRGKYWRTLISWNDFVTPSGRVIIGIQNPHEGPLVYGHIFASTAEAAAQSAIIYAACRRLYSVFPRPPVQHP